LAVHQHRARPDIDPVRDTIAVAALDTGISPIVRVPFMQHTMATRVLDAGALVTASARRDLQHAAPE
jgi:2-keto-3-deoxy-L-rhamnonate aldolase RhmA